MIIKHNSDLYESFEDSLVIGWLPVDIDEAKPIMRWKGPKINIKEVWWPMLAFYKEHIDHEVQTRFVMDKERTRIEIVCFNQKYGTGMSTKELDDPDLQAQLTAGKWINMGTAHSHCKMGAFASHTDRENEAKANPLDRTNNVQVGLHVTVGKLDEDPYDLHLRMVWMVPGQDKQHPARYATLDPVLEDWFDLPPYFGQEVREDPGMVRLILKYLLTQPPPEGTKYPVEWKTKLKEEPKTVYAPQKFIAAGGYYPPNQHNPVQHYRPARPLGYNDYDDFDYHSHAAASVDPPNREPTLSKELDTETQLACQGARDALKAWVEKQERWLGLQKWYDLEPDQESEHRQLQSPLYRKAIDEAETIVEGFGFRGLEEFFWAYIE